MTMDFDKTTSTDLSDAPEEIKAQILANDQKLKDQDKKYRETAVCFLSGNNPFTDNTYPLSEGDKCAIEYINKSLENQRMEAVLQKWTVPDNPRRKKRIEAVDDTYKERVDLFDILAFTIQLAMVMLAWRR